MCAQVVAHITENWINRIMMKRLSLALAGLFAFVAVAQGAGTIPGFSLTPQFDLTAHIMPGCKLYVIQAGTVSTPQNSYSDSGLTLVQPNPLTCDAAGRLPQFFVADGLIKVRLQSSAGVQVFVGDNLLVVGASSGGGGGGVVDPTTVMQTGHLEPFYGTGTLTGFVRCNGRTIGSATSGATERANLDTQALFQYLWGADANLAVSGGRGLTAAADWAANKALTLPDCRGRAMAGVDDMGNTAAGRLTATYFGTAATVLGAAGGNQSHTLSIGEIPANIPWNNAQINLGDSGASNWLSFNHSGALNFGSGSHALGDLTSLSATLFTLTINPSGGGAHSIASPAILITIYIKL